MIRPAGPEDAEAVARVQIETWRAAYSHLFAREAFENMLVEERTANWRRLPAHVADVNGQVVGFVCVGDAHDADAEGEVWAIYVLPEHWGTGIGRKLLKTGEAKLRELGFKNPVLWVFEDNPRTRRFYEAAGWKLDGNRREVELFGMSAPAVRYAKQL